MSKRTRRKHSSQQKAALLKKHHVDKVPVSDVCNDAELQPSVFYHWQRHLFENAATVFDGAKRGAVDEKSEREKQLEARVAQLEAKLAKKDAVIAEISEEFVKVKKTLGEP
jgi:transposase-like protein